MSQQAGGNGEHQEFYFGSDAYVPEKDSKNEIIESETFDSVESIENVENAESADDFSSDEVEESFEEDIVADKKEEKPSRKNHVASIFEWLDVVVASVVVVVVLFTFVFRLVAIDGDSMNNTLFDGERVIISNMFYEPQRGDVVVISRNTENSDKVGSYKEPIIKRVIAVENDKVDIDFETGTVYVNDVELKEDYIKEPIHAAYGTDIVDFPLIVKENCVFVLGDNRNNSLDSRSKQIGQVNVKYILGRAILRIFPLNKFGGID